MAETTAADGVAPEPAPDAQAPVRDAQARDPVRLRLAEALARRANAHAGEARRRIDERVAAIVQSLSELPERAPPARPVAPAAGLGALAALVAHAARRRGAAPGAVPGARPVAAAPGAAAPAVTGAAADEKTVQFFKRTWSRLSADQRLAQSRASLPENAGPLNSQHLVHRSLVLMRELSPEYLEHFVGYIDALQWLEQANEAATQELTNARAAQGRPRSMAARRS
ncbi:MAG TPA: DUF2894 domain-containing protein [Burkholderiaceae bacterium]